MGIKEERLYSCARVVMLTLLACRCSVSAVESESLFCAKSSHSSSTPTSVHSLRPADVSVISALVLSDVERSDEIRALNRLSDIFSTFNPDVLTIVPDQRIVMDQAESITQSLSSTQWNLLLLFVPVDEPCVCEGQDLKALTETVSRVEKELDNLHKKLKHTLVHVIVWGRLPSAESHSRVCQCRREEDYNINRRRLDTVMLMASLQESLSDLLERKGWFSEREDFSVILQSRPVHTDLSSQKEALTHDAAHDISNLALQLWTNLLQPMMDKTEMEIDERGIISIPCPTEESPYLRTQHNSPEPKISLKPDISPLLDPVMGTELICEDRAPSPTVPTSVHTLRPADIKVVAAMGDSLTAANGVGAAQNNLLGVLREFRGLSWCIGGDNNITTVTTLPNILKEFNPSVVGYSLKEGSENLAQSFLNQAVPGAKADDMVKQANAIISRMKTDSRIDFQNDWKVITIFIGGNDICASCSDTLYYSPENIVKRIREALDLLHREVPRALVNLVELLHMVPLRSLHQDPSIGCPTWLVNMLCPCVLKPKDGSLELQKLQDFNKAYQRGMNELVDSGRYDTHENFTAVLQPFLRNVFLPVLEDGRPDRSYFSPDCFHLGQKAHTLMARGLWNNMLEPLGNKTDSQDFTAGLSIKCPEKSAPYLKTYHNSNYTYETQPPTSWPPANWGSDFSCMDLAPSDSVPASVHRLRPGDIKIVASVGDSLTAAFGAKAQSLVELVNEERGVSWSIGGDNTLDSVTTMPNILKKFNPNVFGFSKGKDIQTKGFNMAVSGAKAGNIPSQVRELITTLKSSDKVNFEMDWKLVTLFIGGNDLCQFCHDRASLAPQKYIEHIRDSIDMLYNEVPKVLVNFVEIFEIKNLRKVKRDTLGCSLLQENMCSCFLNAGENSPELSEMMKINRDIQIETERLVYGGRYDGRNDFAVVIQPFLKNTVLPLNGDGTTDLSFFSVDCFHFTERGHAEMAIALWNNMLEPVGSKENYNNFTYDRSKIHCPSKEHPFIFTLVNSVNGDSGVTTTTKAPGTPLPPKCSSDSIPAWGAAILAVGGLVIGWVITWVFFYYRERKNRRRSQSTSENEMKGTTF